ncbi:armadillo-like helical domain-containing protein 2 [Garra rufa]|uniref:armadillo-like helical domain-containing protein 2 n=1 Tax=Garra rufa TaxID=137080 RepID=UPI003CCE9818
MIRFLSSFYDNYIKPYFFSDVEETDRSHKNKIRGAGRLIQNTQLPIAVRADAARDIGILGYTGGYERAAQAADEYMASMVELLKTPDFEDQHATQVLQGLSTICYLHIANQDKAQALGLPNILLEFLSPTSKLSVIPQCWSCYLLNILCCHNIPIICQLKDSTALQASLENLKSLDWDGWPLNYAQELLVVLGFQQSVKNDGLHEEDEQKGCTYTKSGQMLSKQLKKDVYKI